LGTEPYAGAHAGSDDEPHPGRYDRRHTGAEPYGGPHAGPSVAPAAGRYAGTHAGPDDEAPPGRYGGTDGDAYDGSAAGPYVGRHAGGDEPYAGGGRHAAGGGLNGRAVQAGGYGRHLAEPAGPAADGFGRHSPEANGFRYRRPDNGHAGPDAAGWADERAPAHPWGQLNGYHLETPAPPAVNGYRLDEPVAPVTGFPYTAPASAPIAYPVNGHGVDAAERAAASWPVDRHATELDRPLADPQFAVVPLDDEPTQTLARPAPAPDRADDKPPAHPPRAVVRRRRARRKALEWPFLIVFALVSAFLIRQYVVQTFYIPSGSMHETLIEGDRVLVNKVGYHLHDIHRGDIVVFTKPPNLNVSEDDLIKRVVALPGETVEGRGGKVYVNGAALDEPYVEPLCHGTGVFAKVTVPTGKLWVMGDNRCNSSDSRVFGPIDQHLVVGRAFLLAWPFDRLSWL
jgi:signal peptidase I